MDDELRQRRVELVVGERQLLGGREPDVDAAMALLRRRHERLGGIDGGHVVRAEPVDELRRQRAGPAADVEHPLAVGHSGQVGELWRERHRVAPHEPVVRVGGNREAHRRDSRLSHPSGA